MPPVVRPPDPESLPRSADRPWAVADFALLGGGIAAWGWLLAGLRDHPAEVVALAVAVPILAGIGLAVDRSVGRAWGGFGVLAMGIVGFAMLVGVSGANPRTLAGFILGLLKPVGWTGDHLLLRVVPMVMLVAHPWRPSWPGALVSALGVSAFLGIGLLILHAAG